MSLSITNRLSASFLSYLLLKPEVLLDSTSSVVKLFHLVITLCVNQFLRREAIEDPRTPPPHLIFVFLGAFWGANEHKNGQGSPKYRVRREG